MSGAKEIPVQELNVSQLNQLSQQLEQVCIGNFCYVVLRLPKKTYKQQCHYMYFLSLTLHLFDCSCLLIALWF